VDEIERDVIIVGIRGDHRALEFRLEESSADFGTSPGGTPWVLKA
jgi:hypothetical protein